MVRQVSRSYARRLTQGTNAVHTVVLAFIACCIDYCNAILYGVSDVVIRRLQALLQAVQRKCIKWPWKRISKYYENAWTKVYKNAWKKSTKAHQFKNRRQTNPLL